MFYYIVNHLNTYLGFRYLFLSDIAKEHLLAMVYAALPKCRDDYTVL